MGNVDQNNASGSALPLFGGILMIVLWTVVGAIYIAEFVTVPPSP